MKSTEYMTDLEAELLRLTPPELFGFLDDTTQQKLREQFNETIDAEDAGELFFLVMDRGVLKLMDLADKCERSFHAWLDTQDLLNRHRAEIEDRVRGFHG